MPIHDWTKVRDGVFHNFHQAWTIEIYKSLNRGLLPPGYFAMAEQVTRGPIPDIICLEKWPIQPKQLDDHEGGIAVAEKPPVSKFRQSTTANRYAAKANRIVIREPLGEVVAVIEIVSPGNKSNRSATESFVDKALMFLNRGIHLLLVDLFPPSKFDPNGIHSEVWQGLGERSDDESPDKPLRIASYEVEDGVNSYVNAVAVGDELPSASVFFAVGRYVPVPLEATYQTTWADLPAPVRELFDN